jgi:hypothetical protein
VDIKDRLDCAFEVVFTWLCEVMRIDRESSAFNADDLPVLAVSVLEVLVFVRRVVVGEEPQKIFSLQCRRADNNAQLGTTLADLLQNPK